MIINNNLLDLNFDIIINEKALLDEVFNLQMYSSEEVFSRLLDDDENWIKKFDLKNIEFNLKYELQQLIFVKDNIVNHAKYELNLNENELYQYKIIKAINYRKSEIYMLLEILE